nr:alpha/beta hydrolase [Parvularcula mediterranea]
MATPENPRATVMFVPGYTSSPELASDFLSRWYELGFEVASLDLPGQGGSMRRSDDYQKTYTGDFSFYGGAVDQATEHLANVRQSDGPLIVAGDSFGGHAVLRAASDGGAEEADGLFPLVPAVEPNLAGPKWLVKFLVGDQIRSGHATRYLSGGGQWNPDAHKEYEWENCGNRPERNLKNTALQTLNPELRVGGATNEWGLGMVVSGEKMLRSRKLRDYSKPVALLTAGKDTIVRNGPAEKLCTGTMATCQVVRLEEATHCLYLEDQPTQDKVHDALLALLKRIDPEA